MKYYGLMIVSLGIKMVNTIVSLLFDQGYTHIYLDYIPAHISMSDEPFYTIYFGVGELFK